MFRLEKDRPRPSERKRKIQRKALSYYLFHIQNNLSSSEKTLQNNTPLLIQTGQPTPKKGGGEKEKVSKYLGLIGLARIHFMVMHYSVLWPPFYVVSNLPGRDMTTARLLFVFISTLAGRHCIRIRHDHLIQVSHLSRSFSVSTRGRER